MIIGFSYALAAEAWSISALMKLLKRFVEEGTFDSPPLSIFIRPLADPLRTAGG